MASNQPHISSSMESPGSAAVDSKGQNRSPNGSSVEHPSAETATQMPEPMRTEDEGFIGHLDVYVHHARDIQNICIYHKQDVYAKVCLTTDPDTAFSTRTINGGGRNPVFNENLRLNVRTVESSLKCEVWMLSRVKNYLKDQLLGFALVPLSDVVVANGKLDREFQLSSTELFHSPSGFVQLSISYVGSSPDVMTISAPPATSSMVTDTILPDAENAEAPTSEYEKIEFPDLHAVNENKMMLSEYMGIPCHDLDAAECADSLAAAENDECPADTEAGVRIVESFSVGSVDTAELKHDTPQSEVSVNGSPEMDSAVSQSLSEPSSVTECTNLGKNADAADHAEVDSSATRASNVPVVAPVIKINMEPENKVVLQDIVDLYTKSLQQFTESLAKMKLPMEMKDNGSSGSENGKSSDAADQKVQDPKGNGAKVFYGSRAFF